MISLVIFITSQAILNQLDDIASTSGSASAVATSSRMVSSSENDSTFENRLVIFICRCFIYLCSMGQLIYTHGKHIYRSIKAKDFISLGLLKLPGCLAKWQEVVGCALTLFLLVMMCLEPILHCISNNGGNLFTENCAESKSLLFPYSIFSAMALMCYYLLLVDLAVLSTRISAFVLVCGRLLSEVALFLFGLTFFAVTFASAVSALEQDDPDFGTGIPHSFLAFVKVTLSMLAGEQYDSLSDFPVLLIAVLIYVITTVVFLLNLLIAQLNCAYQATYQDMLGFARLNRGKIVTDTMPSVPVARWERFITSLKLDDRVEFGEGDLGLSGGIQILEAANANITTVDMIRRFGGSTSILAQWPEEAGGNDEEDRLERIEKTIEKTIKQMSTSKGSNKKGSAVGSSNMDTGGSGTGDGSARESG